MAFGKESKEKLLSLILADSFIKIIDIYIYEFRVETPFMPKWTIFWFQNIFIQILWIFSCNKCILARLGVKVFVSQEWVQAKTKVNTL